MEGGRGSTKGGREGRREEWEERRRRSEKEDMFLDICMNFGL